MCADFITPPVPSDPAESYQVGVDTLQSRVPAWNDADPGLVSWLLEAFAQMIAQFSETASETLTSDFRWIGPNLANVPVIEAEAASGTVTITGTAGQVVPAGTHMYATVGDSRFGFTTTDDGTLTAGTAAAVPILADDTGEDYNDITGSLTLQDRYDFVETITLDAATAGGVDAEDDDVYLDRLASRTRTFTDTPILPADFEEIALQVPGVWRALAIDGYDPAVNPGTWDPDDMNTWELATVAVASVDEDGEAVVNPVKAAVDVLFNGDGGENEGLRETGFTIPIIDPTYTTIGCTFTFTAAPGYDPAAVTDAAEEAVADFLDPANWGRSSSVEFNDRTLDREDTVYAGKVYEVLYGVPGVRAVTALSLSGGSASGSDRLLSGAAPLTRAGTITGTAA